MLSETASVKVLIKIQGVTTISLIRSQLIRSRLKIEKEWFFGCEVGASEYI